MKAKFYFLDTENRSERVDIFESDIPVIPKKKNGVWFPFMGGLYWSHVISIDYCFDMESKFSYIDIELDSF